MSAGSGLTHSEYNNSTSEDVNFLQIWVFPKERDISPRYDQKMFAAHERENTFQTIVSPESSEKSVRINQDAWFSMADVSADHQLNYQKKRTDNGVYYFVIKGELIIEGNRAKQRDGLGITGGHTHFIEAQIESQVLAIEVPLQHDN